MPGRNTGKLSCRFRALFLLHLSLLAGCARPRNAGYIVLSYSERSSFCLGCPNFRVELRAGGQVNLFGLSGCAIPGEYRFRVPETAFSSLLDEFEKARFLSTRRLDPRYSMEDALVKRLGYGDEIRTHEVVDAGRPLPAISQLEKHFRDTTQIERYLAPSLALYRDLVKSGWNVNTLGEDRENALVPAIVAGDSASIVFLLQHGATVSETAFEFAVQSKRVDVFRMLAAARRTGFRSAEGGRLLLAAVGTSSAGMVQELLDRGAPVNYRQPESNDTPLLLLAGNTEQTDIAHMLIERGAGVNARNWMGQTALFRAATGTNTGMIELLAAHGADPNSRDQDGRTALVLAASRCQYWNIKALLAHGADPFLRDDRGRTALKPDYVDPSDPKCNICRQLLREAYDHHRRKPG